jgi:tRNA(His) guanylyltransferase
MNGDEFGDRMKELEGAEAGRRFMKLLPVMARVDGRGFSNLTRKMARPYDPRMSALMVATTRYLVQETNACMGYTQSDEISLTWYSPTYDSQIFFDGRIQKMTSQLAALASAYFNDRFTEHFDPKEFERPRLATFDCRTWQVPNLVEGANTFLWREQDATKNSVSMAARAHFSHERLMNKGRADMQEMLFQEAGVNWNNYPAFFKRGSYLQRKVVRRRFSAEELDRLPAKHEARRNPDLEVERTEYRVLAMPPFGKVTNRPEVIYQGADPVTAADNAA